MAMPNLIAWYGNARLSAGAFLLVATLGGCASLVPQTMALRDAWPAGVVSRAELDDVPFFPQQAFQCGPAALATTLVHGGMAVTPGELVKRVYIPERLGSLQIEMLAAARTYSRVSYQLAPRFDDLLREVAAGNPVIVLQDNGIGPLANWHYAVVVGFDYQAGELYLRSGETKRQALPFTIFEYTWRKSNYWAMLTLPPDRIPVTAVKPNYLAAIAAMERVGEPRAAMAAYAAFLDRWPDDIAASVGLANQHYVHGALKDAEFVLRQAVEHHPDSVIVLNNLAQTLSDQGQNGEALALIERAERPPENPFAEAVRETHDRILERIDGKRRKNE